MKPHGSRPSRATFCRLGIAITIAAFGLLLPRPARGFACAWTGGTSTNWATASNWSSCNGTTPQSGDTATINSGGNQPTLSGSATVGQITLGAGATLTVASGGSLTMNNGLTGGGNLTVNSGGTLTWAGGAMDGAGTTAISSGGTLSITGVDYLYRALTNAGTGKMTAGYLYMFVGSSFTNSGTFEIAIDSGFYAGSAGVAVTNSGTIKRTTTTGNAFIQTIFNNSGSVQVQSGTFQLSGGGNLSGTFDATGNTLQFTAGTWATTAGFTGGALIMSGGTLNFNSGATFTSIDQMTISAATVNFNTAATVTPSNLTLSGGTLAGSNNVALASGGMFTWSGGTMSGTGTTTVASGRTLLVNGAGYLYRPLVNAGTGTMNASGYTYIYTGGSFTNSGTFEIAADSGFYPGNAGVAVTNSGTLKRTTTTGNAFIQTIFNNSGSVQVQSGTFQLSGGGTLSGTFDATGNTLQFTAGTWATTAGFTGGTLIMSNGTLNFNSGATFTSIDQMTISGATVNFNTAATVTPSNLTLSGGTLAGSNNVTLASGGMFTWSGGTMSGTGTTTVASGRTLLVNGGVSLYRPLVNAGTGTMNASGYTYIYTGGSFTNSGTFEIAIDSGFYPGNAGVAVTNSGTLKRTTTTGNAYIQTIFNNSGSVQVQSGTFQLTGGGTLSGTFDATGNTLQFAGGTWATTAGFTGGTLIMNSGTLNFNSGATFTSIDQMTISGATVNFNTAATVTPSNLTLSGGTLAGSNNVTLASGGIFTWSGGTMSGTGTTTVASGRTLLVNGAGSLYRPLVNAGTATMNASGYMYMYTGGSFTNSGTFEIQNDYGFYPGSAGVNVTNSGTLSRTTSANPAYVQTGFSNTGTVDLQTGTLSFTAFTQTAGATHLNGGTLQQTSGSINIQGGVLDGNGNIDGNVAVSGSGQFNPGTSPGEISIINNHTYSQANPGVLNIDVNGLNPGIDFDRVLISGAANLGGELKVSLGYTPAVGDSFKFLQHASRTGTFSKLTLPSPGTALGWSIDYEPTFTSLTIAQINPGSMGVDDRVGAGTVSDANGVLEPGERVVVEPSWQNMTESVMASISGTASNVTGPAGPTYTLNDTTANYGTINAATPGSPVTANCFTATGDCYQVQVSAPAARPATHWDATFKEAVTGGINKTWTLHVGDSFTDVPRTQPFYQKIETVLHNGITAGCNATQYCPTQNVNRGQMAIFIAKGIAGGGANVPVSGTVGVTGYNCVAGGASAFIDVTPTDIYCKHVHYIAAQNVTLGCNPNQYCPAGNVTRQEMAAFIAKAIVAPAGGTAIPSAYGPDPVTGFSYNCNGANIHFTDVAYNNPFCKHIHYLWAKGIIAGCSPTTYCPLGLVTRDAMAKFLTNAFNLLLYGPTP